MLNPDGTENTDAGFIGNRNHFRYRGYYYEQQTNLYFLKSRFYDPEVGRFISADTVDYLAPDTVNGLNLYAYCGNNPVMKVDPSGHVAVSTIVLIACIAIGAIALGIAGGVYAYNKATDAGATGVAFAAQTTVGVVGGALIDAAFGALFGFLLPYFGAFLSASFTFSLPAIASVSGGAAVAASVTVTGAEIVAGALVAGGAIALGVGLVFSKHDPGMSNRPPRSWTNNKEGLEAMRKHKMNANKAAEDIMNAHFDEWRTGAGTDYNAIKKWLDRVIRKMIT